MPQKELDKSMKQSIKQWCLLFAQNDTLNALADLYFVARFRMLCACRSLAIENMSHVLARMLGNGEYDSDNSGGVFKFYSQYMCHLYNQFPV